MKKVKWAQLTKLERAYERVDRNNNYFNTSRKGISKNEARKRNKYYQLLGHWCKLKKEADAQTS